MGEYLGRKVLIEIDGTTVGNGRTKTLNVNNEMINITTDDDAGIQKFLNEPGEKAVEFSFEGLAIADDLLTKALSNDLSASIVFTFPAEAGSAAFTLTGEFVMPSYSLGLPYNEASTISATFSSSGAVVKAPA